MKQKLTVCTCTHTYAPCYKKKLNHFHFFIIFGFFCWIFFSAENQKLSLHMSRITAYMMYWAFAQNNMVTASSQWCAWNDCWNFIYTTTHGSIAVSIMSWSRLPIPQLAAVSLH